MPSVVNQLTFSAAYAQWNLSSFWQVADGIRSQETAESPWKPLGSRELARPLGRPFGTVEFPESDWGTAAQFKVGKPSQDVEVVASSHPRDVLKGNQGDSFGAGSVIHARTLKPGNKPRIDVKFQGVWSFMPVVAEQHGLS